MPLAFWSIGRIIRRPPWGRVKLVPIHSVSSWSFCSFCVVVCWCNHFPPFVRVLFGEFEFSVVRLGSNRKCEVFHRSFEFSIGFLEFLAVCAVFDRLFGAFFRSIAFLVSELGACWRSGSFVVKLQVSVKVSTSDPSACCRSCVFESSWEFESF